MHYKGKLTRFSTNFLSCSNTLTNIFLVLADEAVHSVEEGLELRLG